MPFVTIWLLGISVMDFRSRRVSVWLLAIGGGLTAAVLICQYGNEGIELYGLLKGMLPGLVLLVVSVTTKKAGYGDGIVVLFLGMISGGAKSLVLFGVSLFLISIWSVILLILKKVGRNTQIPYLPFLAVAWLLAGEL